MNAAKQWLDEVRWKHRCGQLTDADFDALAELLDTRQRILVLTSKDSSLRSPINGWRFYEPSNDEIELPGNAPPYPNVFAAVQDGWRIIQFPVVQAVNRYDLSGEYIGFDFYLERYA